jgi:hypothetical protein
VTGQPLPVRVRVSSEPIRYFFDESALGIGQIVAAARSDTVYPGHPRSPIRPGDLDPDWIPIIARNQWVVIMRDKRLRTRPAEKRALVVNPLRALVLTTAGQLEIWDQLRILMRAWDRIEELVAGESSPWWYTITRAGLRRGAYPSDRS